MGLLTLVLGGIAGAGLMYLLDPNTGKRRRALLRDQLEHLQNTMPEQMETLKTRTGDKARGAVAETKRQFEPDEVSNETLVARVRSEMGRYVSHPGAVIVKANEGEVTLTGNILTAEVQPFVAAVKSLPGVRRVNNHLHEHTEAGNVPDLQGGETRTELR